jgi:geranylgeranyl diphosphate synthase type I
VSELSSLKDQFEVSLKQLVLARTPESMPGLREMVSYHFGWNEFAPKTGKRLRPLLLLTSSQMFGGQPLRLMPAAVAMEVLHNYTLVHDDIEDQGETRHGRECLWRRYGLAQALNVGDFLSTMANDIFYEVAAAVDTEVFARAYSVFRQATLGVLRGQYLDIHFETEKNVSVDQYLEMISLKTSCLISASIRIGAILSGVDEDTDNSLLEIGEHAGLAFQIQDDYLGIWGDTSTTGKSNLTDLTTRKKTFPILLGLAECPVFKSVWDANDQITPELARQLAGALSDAGIDKRTNNAVLHHLLFIKAGQKHFIDSNYTSTDLWDLLNSAFTPTFASSLKPNTLT